MTVLNIMSLRLRSMYASFAVRSLAVLVTIVIAVLISGLYRGAENSTKLKIAVFFERESEFTDQVFASMEKSEILLPMLMNKAEGLSAVEEGRVQSLYVFDETMEDRLREGDIEGFVDVYYLEENFVPYLITDVVGSELIGEIAILRAMSYMEDVLDETKSDVGDRNTYFQRLYDYGKNDLDKEKDNFFVEKTYIVPEGSKDLSYVALENVLLFKQVILGVVYIFVAFFMLFLVVTMVRDEEVGLRPKWMTTPMGRFQIIIGEYLSIVIASMPIILMVTLVQSYFETECLFFLVTNCLYALTFAGILMLFGKIIRVVTVYVVVSSAIIIIIGIVSGSFFMLNTQQSAMASVTYWIPTYKLLEEVVRVQLVNVPLPSKSYVIYMLVYSCMTVFVAYIIDWLKYRRT